MDAINLQCESILYERGHFLKEIAIERDFHSKYPPLELVAEEEFYLTQPSARSLTPHQLRIARLKDEFDRREKLLLEQRAMEAKNAELTAVNEEMKRRKKNFNDRMKSVYMELQASEGEWFTTINGDSTNSATSATATAAATAVPMER